MINLITLPTGRAQQRLETAIDQAQQSLVKASEATMPTAEEHLRVMQIKPPQNATEPVKLDFSGTPGDVVNVLVAQTGAKVEAVDAKAVGFVGTGEVTVTTTDGSGTLVVGDAFAQKLDGSQNSGHDTLIGGAGNDTLVGGAGDVIGFNGLGHFTVVGTEKGVSFTFLFEGIHSVQDLAQYLTGITETASGVTFHFGDAASITLVGVSASQVTADMIHFNL
jgi:Ca2+-binding RTX toxin-like protein